MALVPVALDPGCGRASDAPVDLPGALGWRPGFVCTGG